jgi:hypothetical protein
MSFDSSDYQMMPTNFLLSAGAGGFAFFVANLDPVITVALPLVLFILGKGIDVAVKLYLEKKKSDAT